MGRARDRRRRGGHRVDGASVTVAISPLSGIVQGAGAMRAGNSPASFDGPRQSWDLRPVTLAQFSGIGSAKTGPVTFRVNMPDSRVRVKLSLVFVPSSGAPGALAGKGIALWLSEIEYDRQTSGLTIPSVNIEGTSAAPTLIFNDNALSGYSREFVTAADGVQGVVTIPAQLGDGKAGLLQLQGRMQPEAQRLTDEEWLAIRNAFTCSPPQQFSE